MQTGTDRLFEDDALAGLRAELQQRAVAVLSHPASVDRHMRHLVWALHAAGIKPTLLFGPEHGFGGEAQYMASVADDTHHDGVRIRSLYGAAEADLAPVPADFEGIDVLLIDLQDVGSRYYTYVWTALLATLVARAAGTEVVILDRPNPLGLCQREGALPVDPLYLSFVGLRPLPIRHGLTLGDIVAHFAPGPGLRIVRTRGVADELLAHDWDRPFVLPSPNMPTADTALVYPGGCLLEGTNLSEGRGTCRPFEIVGAPYLEGEALASALRAVDLPGFAARPLRFVPTFEKHAGVLCGGVQIHVTDRRAFRPVATYAALLACAYNLAKEEFRFRDTPYEFRDDVPALDLLAGGPQLREAIVAGAPVRDIAEALSAAVGTETTFKREVVAFPERDL